jgi:O-antigen ligase
MVQKPISEILDRVLFFGLLGLLLCAPLTFGATEPWSLFLQHTGAALLLLVWAARQLVAHELVVRSNPAFLPMALFGALISLQLGLGYTAYPYATESAALNYAAYGLLCFLAIQILQQERSFRAATVIVSSFGLTLSLVSLFQQLAGNGKLLWIRTAPQGSLIYGPYSNHNHYAGLMEMLFPIPLVASFLPRNERKDRVFCLTAAAVMAATIFLSGSRGGMLAFSAEILVLLLLVRRKRTSSRLALAVFLAILAALIIWVGAGPVVDRVQSIATSVHDDASAGLRNQINQDTIRMFMARPILGWGLGVFPDVFPSFRSFYITLSINGAHNDYLQLLAETGLLGFSIAGLLVVTTYRKGLAKLRSGALGTRSGAALACLMAITGILVHSFFDFNLEIPANAVWFFVLCTIAAGDAPPKRRSERHSVVWE